MSKQAAAPAIDWSQWKKVTPPIHKRSVPNVTVSVTKDGAISVCFNALATAQFGFATAKACDVFEGTDEREGSIIVKANDQGNCGVLHARGTMARFVFRRPSNLAPLKKVSVEAAAIEPGIVLITLPDFKPRVTEHVVEWSKDETAANGEALTAFDRKVKDLLAQRMNAPTIAETLKTTAEHVLASLRKQGLVA